jgi:S1-C subfamily serine protease
MFSSSDYVITIYHVVHGSKSIIVRLTNGERIDASIDVKDTNNDIATLKLSKSSISRQNVITFGDSTSVKTGDRILTYGFPLDRTIAFEGWVTFGGGGAIREK